MKCKQCGKELKEDWRKSKKAKNKPLEYCSMSCSNTHRLTAESKAKISAGVKAELQRNPRTWTEAKKKQIGKSVNKNRTKEPQSILEVSSRTAKKITIRMKLECSICGWNKAACDLHHITPKKEGGTNTNSNLTNVCPNCHREIHSGLVPREDLISLEEQIGDNWKEYYYA